MILGKSTNADVELAMLTEARNEVGAADHKASMVLAVLGIGFGALLAGLIARDWSPNELNTGGQVLWWSGAMSATASVIAAANAVWPRFKIVKSPPTVFYWGHVAAFEDQRDLERALDKRPPELEDRTRHQLFELSTIVAKKYRRVRAAMILSIPAAVLFLGASFVGY